MRRFLGRVWRFAKRKRAGFGPALFGAIDSGTQRILNHAIRIGRRWTERRLAQGRPRSLWGITPILTLPVKARSDETLGFRSESLVYTTYVITSGFDYNLRKIVGLVWRIDQRLWLPFHRLILAWALLRYDVFNTFADRGVLPPPERYGIDPIELDAWKAAGKNVYIYAYGADVRIRERTLKLGRWNFCVDCPEPPKFCVCDDATGKRLMEQMAARSTAMVALGDMLVYMPDVKHLDYWPIDMLKTPLRVRRASQEPLRIAHAPNHTHFKGSHYLETVIEKLRAEGHAIEYVKVQGVPNKDVIGLFAKSDVVADQFIGGAYGYTALEALALGKPVLTYVRTPDLALHVEECPFFNVTPDRIEPVMRWLLANREMLPVIGAQGRAYVERWHSVEAVGARFGELYLETAGFPENVNGRIREAITRETARREQVRQVPNWQHPWRIGEPGA